MAISVSAERDPQTRIFFAATSSHEQRYALEQGLYTDVRPLRSLISFYFWEKANLDVDMAKLRALGSELEVFADSGGFSAFMKGTTIPLQNYLAWVKKWKHWLSHAAGPDVIGDAEATTRDTEIMMGEISGLPILPAFHVTEDWKWLEYWMTKVDYLALGGMVPYAGSKSRILDAWLTKAFKMIPSHVKVHGFGLTRWDLIKKHPFYSVDSSSWNAAARYAILNVFDEETGVWTGIDLRFPSQVVHARKLLERYGVTVAQVRAKGRPGYLIQGAVCVESWRRAERWLHRFKLRTKGQAA